MFVHVPCIDGWSLELHSCVYVTGHDKSIKMFLIFLICVKVCLQNAISICPFTVTTCAILHLAIAFVHLVFKETFNFISKQSILCVFSNLKTKS